jgi:hypothetical protein
MWAETRVDSHFKRPPSFSKFNQNWNGLQYWRPSVFDFVKKPFSSSRVCTPKKRERERERDKDRQRNRQTGRQRDRCGREETGVYQHFDATEEKMHMHDKKVSRDKNSNTHCTLCCSVLLTPPALLKKNILSDFKASSQRVCHRAPCKLLNVFT